MLTYQINDADQGGKNQVPDGQPGIVKRKYAHGTFINKHFGNLSDIGDQ